MLKDLVIIKGLSDEDLVYLGGFVSLIDNDGYVVIPEDQYDAIPEYIGNKYGIHAININDQF